MKQNYFFLGLLVTMTMILGSCKKEKEDKPDILISKVVIDNIMEFNYYDSISYAAFDTVVYKINIKTEPENADIYYENSLEGFVKLDSDWIIIDSSNKILSFYAVKAGYNQTETKRIDFDFSHDTLIQGLEVSANEGANNVLTIDNIPCNQRGELYVYIDNLQGETLYQTHYKKTTCYETFNYIIGGLKLDTYNVRIDFGGATMHKQIVFGY